MYYYYQQAPNIHTRFVYNAQHVKRNEIVLTQQQKSHIHNILWGLSVIYIYIFKSYQV